ncbi:MAG: hypothetical protein WCK51_08605 [Armatimonadota bacterium]
MRDSLQEFKGNFGRVFRGLRREAGAEPMDSTNLRDLVPYNRLVMRHIPREQLYDEIIVACSAVDIACP